MAKAGSRRKHRLEGRRGTRRHCDQHTAAKHVQQAVNNMKTGHPQRQTDEERHALCRQHAIVDNNEVKGPRKCKHINEPGKGCHATNSRAHANECATRATKLQASWSMSEYHWARGGYA